MFFANVANVAFRVMCRVGGSASISNSYSYSYSSNKVGIMGVMMNINSGGSSRMFSSGSGVSLAGKTKESGGNANSVRGKKDALKGLLTLRERKVRANEYGMKLAAFRKELNKARTVYRDEYEKLLAYRKEQLEIKAKEREVESQKYREIANQKREAQKVKLEETRKWTEELNEKKRLRNQARREEYLLQLKESQESMKEAMNVFLSRQKNVEITPNLAAEFDSYIKDIKRMTDLHRKRESRFQEAANLNPEGKRISDIDTAKEENKSLLIRLKYNY